MGIEGKQINENSDLQKQEISKEDALNKGVKVKSQLEAIRAIERMEDIVLDKIEKGEIAFKDNTEIDVNNIEITSIDGNNFAVNLNVNNGNFPEEVINDKGEWILNFDSIYNDPLFNKVVELTGIKEIKERNNYIYKKDGKNISLLDAFGEYRKELFKLKFSTGSDYMITEIGKGYDIVPTKDELFNIVENILDSESIYSFTDNKLSEVILDAIRDYTIKINTKTH